MLKTRKRWISLLLTLAMLVVFCVPVGTAFADTTYGNFSGAYKYVSVDTNQSAGSAQVAIKSTSGADTVYVKVTLPAGVKYNTKPTNATADYVYYSNSSGVGKAGMTFVDSADNMLQVKITPVPSVGDIVKFTFGTAGSSAIDVGSDVSGDIKATVEIMGVSGSDIVWVESDSVTIAKTSAKDVTVTAGDSKLIEAGTTAATGADITIQESRPATLTTSDVVYAQIETSDVTFATLPGFTAGGGFAAADLGASAFGDADRTLAYVPIVDTSSVLPGKITVSLTDALAVPPSVTGDIKITIYSSYGSSKLKKTTVTVATIGTGSASVKNLKDNTDVCYAGQVKTLSAKFDLESTSGSKMKQDKTVIFDLVNGKWDKSVFTVGSTYFNYLKYQGAYNDDKTLWFTITGSDPDKITGITGFAVKAPGDVPAGDIVAKISGSAGASGEVVLGKYAAPVTLSADKPQVKLLATDQAAGNILIKEADAGVLKAGKYIALELPTGVSFSEVPKAKVTAGNIKIGDLSIEDSVLFIQITAKSGIASTIEISNIKYDLNKLAQTGDISLKLLGGTVNDNETINEVDAKSLGKVVNATAVSETSATATLKIGDPNIVINGVAIDMGAAPFVKDQRTFIPVRFAAKAVGVSDDNIMWDQATKKVTILKGDRVVQFTIGSKVMLLNGAAVTMDTTPEVKPGRILVPVRYLSQALGANITWDQETQTVTIKVN